jgi:antitoxin (DNA-binding transcriptional repressor) of toxin-antitoxin stability system
MWSSQVVTWYDHTVKTIAAAQFKAHCLAILDDVDDEGVVITKRGKPVAVVRRYPEHRTDGDLIGILAGKVGITGDIMSTGAEWQPGEWLDAQP